MSDFKFGLSVSTDDVKAALRPILMEILAEYGIKMPETPKPAPTPAPAPIPAVVMPTNDKPIIIEWGADGSMLVRALASLGKLKYVLVDNEAAKFAWIGAEHQFEPSSVMPFTFKPAFTRNGQRYKVLTLDNKIWADGPLSSGIT
jgi:hypothetical protein